MQNRIFIVYCSPAGSTRHVAGVIEQALADRAVAVHRLDMGRENTRAEMADLLKEAGPNDCLFIGSPVYRDLAVPPVMAFIEGLSAVQKSYAVPFVTWGGACSGLALWQMGQALGRKGFTLAGAAKVLALHSLMWQSDQPVGSGHPDAGDDEAVGSLAGRICEGLQQQKIQPLPLADLEYTDKAYGIEIKKKLDQPWMIIPKTVDTELCTRCGLCAEECPAEAIVLDPDPILDERCFDCFNCIRLCPEEAIVPAKSLREFETLIRQRAEKFNEHPVTQIFIK